ncbi:MAG: NusG domain II-containing protein [Ruminococcus sp.]|nr:NusG domain II-containing protein [Ruminococcus sp.]
MKMNKRDFIAIAVVVILSAAGFLFLNIGHAQGSEVVITLGGSEYGIYPLADDKVIEIKSDVGLNTVVIENGSVYMKDADCPDRYCVKQGKVKVSGDSVICLPHKLVVEVKSQNGENTIDAVAK